MEGTMDGWMEGGMDGRTDPILKDPSNWGWGSTKHETDGYS